jgi:hypothetical protein
MTRSYDRLTVYPMTVEVWCLPLMESFNIRLLLALSVSASGQSLSCPESRTLRTWM